MNPVKFRIWDESFGQMCQVSTIHWLDQDEPIKKVEGHGLTKPFGYRDIAVTEKNPLLQDTTLKDKGGNSVYAEHILKFNLRDSDGKDTGTIVYGDVYFEEGRWTARNLGGLRFDAMEIVGTVRENPELLQATTV